MTSAPEILMCPPDHYGIHYEINPWMSRRRACDRRRAAGQWRRLRRLLEEARARIRCLEPVPGLPDLVFTANAALVYENTAVLSRFRYPQRQAEASHNLKWLEASGFSVLRLPVDASFEGAGDALFLEDTLFAGYRIRSDVVAHQQLGAMLDLRVIPLELVDPDYYHLDTCFCPLAPGAAIYYPRAFDAYGRRVLARSIPDLIPVSTAEARRFACNAVVVGRTVITNTGCSQLHRQLRARGFAPRATPLDEFVKSGGSAKCLTLRLDGEEAAAWRPIRGSSDRQRVVGEKPLAP
ncbi:MAG: dimethylarginine dimethylaminohydrolase family protein [Planctomycetota bacterium]|jgi:N-dimethylarginine dimethylaminohydrolase